MKQALLLIVATIFLTGCFSLGDKPITEPMPGFLDDLSEADLSDSAVEALAIGSASGTKAFTYVGLGLFAIGAVLFATIAKDSGLKLILCGAIAGAVPYVVQSSAFNYIVASAGAAVGGILIYHLWWKIRKVEVSEEQKS